MGGEQACRCAVGSRARELAYSITMILAESWDGLIHATQQVTPWLN